MKLVTATPNALYCDTDQVLTTQTCVILRKNGFRGVWRYLSDLSTLERDIILASGLELYFVNHSRARGWLPSAAAGHADATRDIGHANRLSLPPTVQIAFDLEGPGGTQSAVIDHVRAHGQDILLASFNPSLYVGEGSMLTSVQLYALPSRLYWQSCSKLVDGVSGLVPDCGYAITQGSPFDVVLYDGPISITIDVDFVRQDFKGRLPVGIAL